MAVKYYSTAQLKDLALLSAQRMNATLTVEDADNAYAEACSRSGFENPLSSDTDYAAKQYWLIQLMDVFYLKEVLKPYLVRVDSMDVKLSQASKSLREEIDRREKAFEKARESEATASLFVDSDAYFGELVIGSGIVDDAVGVDYRT